MIKATSIKLTRAEGPTAHTGTVTITDAPLWANAERQLSRWRVTAARIGYDKTDFTVTFADGETYEGCYLLAVDDFLTLSGHIRGFLKMATTHGLLDTEEVTTWLDAYALNDEGVRG